MTEKRKQDFVNASVVTAILMLIVVGIAYCRGGNIEPVVIGSSAAVVFVMTFVYSSFSEQIDRFQEKHKVFSSVSSALLITAIFIGARVLNGKMEWKTAGITGILFFIVLSVINYRSICTREKKKEITQ